MARQRQAVSTPASNMIPVDQVVGQLGSAGLGFERVKLTKGSTYQDSSTIIVIPTRGAIDYRVVQRWQNLVGPMNQRRTMIFAAGHEVGRAYDAVISQILAEPSLRDWKYILTLEDDNLPPPDAHVRLIESIEMPPKFDAVSAIYFTKGDTNMPMCYGDPDEFRRSGVLDFRPRDISAALQAGQVMECNGIAMGCALWRLDLFRQLPPPWFVSVSDYHPGKGVEQMTQDLYFCRTARQAGKRFAVDLRVRVGHLDINTGRVY